MKKVNIILMVAIVIFIVMLIPIPNQIKNGDKEYKAVLYTYTKIHRPSDISLTGYQDGLELKILGIRIGGNVNIDVKNVQKNTDSVVLEVKEDTRTSKGATFIIKNNADEEYSYGDVYAIEKFENGSWEELDTLTGTPLSWNAIVYTLKSNDEREISINWSLGYGKLTSGTYRLVKNDIRKSNSSESRTYTVYAEFDIK